MRKLSKIFVLMMFLTICGCSSIRSGNLVPLNETIANAIKITYKTGPQIQATDTLDFWITNTSKYCIDFPIDFGLKIIMELNGGWNAVANTVNYKAQPGQDEVSLDPAGGFFPERTVGAGPDLSNITLTGPTNFQAIITGHLCDDKSVVIEKRVPFTVSP